MAISRLLIANRGEIACRVIRTAKELGIFTIAVYSEADKYTPHVKAADESVFIGPPSPSDSYLSIDNICQAIDSSGADAVHPGYGFLSENPAFAQRLHDKGITFVGPTANAIEQMGNKATAKQLMQKAGIVCVPGYEGNDQSDAAFIEAAEAIGYPVMVKAAAGGGGRGMRLVAESGQLTDALSVARTEAGSAFSNDELILEKAIIEPRHVEVQILADNNGHCIHLGERDCSIQRRHQKLIEESPCGVISAELQERMGTTAIKVAKTVNYTGAGTVEFLVDSTGEFFFLEMNTRLQVEHPVTEMVTGIDLVALQLQIASGQPLDLQQADIQLKGHAIEARLCAEDPSMDFLPTTGVIHHWREASADGVRIDTGIESGMAVTPWYDSMLAKVIAHGTTREQARQKLCRALADTTLLGIASNQQFLHSMLMSGSFTTADISTAFISDNWPNGYKPVTAPKQIEAIAIALLCQQALNQSLRQSAAPAHSSLIGWSSAGTLEFPFELINGQVILSARVSAGIGGQQWRVSLDSTPTDEQSLSDDEHQYDVELTDLQKNHGTLDVNGTNYNVDYVCIHSPDQVQIFLSHGADTWQFRRLTAGSIAADATNNINNTDHSANITAPLPGVLVELFVGEGQVVNKGQTLAIVEAMKMQHQITAKTDGVVKRISAKLNTQVRSGELLIEIDSTQ